MDKHEALEQIMAELVKEDICFASSGGVDSSLLLKVAADAAAKAGKNIYAVTFDSKLHPSRSLEIVTKAVEELGGTHKVIPMDELEQKETRNNPVNHCYLCKCHLFQSLKDFTGIKGIRTIINGANEDGMHVCRPGIKVLKKLGIISPLAELHITKAEAKSLAVECEISVVSRPSTPYMATRLPHNTETDYEALERITQGEACLRKIFSGNIRPRLRGDIVRIEMDTLAMPEILEKRQQVITYLRNLRFLYITLDLEGS